MKGLEFGPLKGVDVELSKEREPSMRAALAGLLVALGTADRAGAFKILSFQPQGWEEPMVERLGEELRGLYRSLLAECGQFSKADRDEALRRATNTHGAPDPQESMELSDRFEVQVYAWESGHILAFYPVGERFRDVTDDILNELDKEEDPAPPEPEPEPENKVTMLDSPPPSTGRNPADAIRRQQDAVFCMICGKQIMGEPHNSTDQQGCLRVTHPRCYEEEQARRNARGMYGTAEQMRAELAQHGRPVGEVWEVAELEARVLEARRKTDAIDWIGYETKAAQRKQRHPCVICDKDITKGQDYKQASRGRKAHRVCLLQESHAPDRG